ncbi:MAG: hypothetical protein BMS9Abin29_1627 [Gemmatimonadota bacterium]|nr:MAG: hypothetical protein BMS9Abin29_1627 [Gemmatimonadota bacterium]
MKHCKAPGIRVASASVGFRCMGRVAPASSVAAITLGAVTLLTLMFLPSRAVAQRPTCWICEPLVLLEPAAFVRNLDSDPESVDLLARIHIMAPTRIPRLGVSLVTQWVAPHGSSPMIMAHLSYALWQRPVSVAPFLGMMNVRFRGESVIRPMTALYVTAPTGFPQVRFYALMTLLLADEVVPSLAFGLRVPFAPLPKKGGM